MSELIEGLYTKRTLITGASGVNPSQIVAVNQINKGRSPIVIPTQVLSVPTSLSLIYSTTLNVAMEVHAILIIPTSNAQVNGVQFYLNYGNNTIGTPQNLSGIIVPITIGFDEGDYPILDVNSVISLNAVASSSGAGLQIIVVGVAI